MELPVWFEVTTLVGLTVMLLADLAIVARRPHEPSMKEAGLWVGFYVALALIFGAVFWAVTNGTLATEFYAGWLTEYSLSVDNLFVFVIIMAASVCHETYQQKLLLVGIVLALVLRGVFIAGRGRPHRAGSPGSSTSSAPSWSTRRSTWSGTAVRRTNTRRTPSSGGCRKVLPITQDYHGAKIRVTENGKRFFTPMIIVMIAIGTTDLIFALDSHPGDLRPHPGAVHRLHRQRLRAHGPAPALLPAGRAAATGWSTCPSASRSSSPSSA